MTSHCQGSNECNAGDGNGKRTYVVALIGSSGGGTATLGHTRCHVLIDTIRHHFQYGIRSHHKTTTLPQVQSSSSSSSSSKVELSYYVWVSMDNGQGFDGATGDEHVTLYVDDKDDDDNDDDQAFGDVRNYKNRETLQEINELVHKIHDQRLAQLIRDGRIDGIICVSCRPEIFTNTFREVVKHNLPVTGTGGTSLSLLADRFNVRIVGNAGGSVATTPETKAVSFCGSLASAFGLKYNPWNVKKHENAYNDRKKNTAVPSVTSVLNGCLPAFWAVMLFKRFVLTVVDPLLQTIHHTSNHQCQLAGSESEQLQQCTLSSLLTSIHRLETELLPILDSYAIPVVCAVTMASSRRQNTEGVIMSSIVAGCACKDSVLGGLLAGWMVAFGEEALLYQCILTFNVPATMTNLLTSGMVGIIVAMIMTIISPMLAFTTEMYRQYTLDFLWTPHTIDSNLEVFRMLLVSLLGTLFCYGSKIGWYHSIFLPLILVEMEKGDPSMLGTLDFLTLVCVCAGVCSGLWFTTSSTGTSAGHNKESLSAPSSSSSSTNHRLAKRGFLINILCGDYIEACYPYMESNAMVNLSGYVASSLSATILTGHGCKSSAYLPATVALWLADDVYRILMATSIAFGIPFLVTLLNQWLVLSINLVTLVHSG